MTNFGPGNSNAPMILDFIVNIYEFPHKDFGGLMEWLLSNEIYTWISDNVVSYPLVTVSYVEVTQIDLGDSTNLTQYLENNIKSWSVIGIEDKSPLGVDLSDYKY